MTKAYDVLGLGVSAVDDLLYVSAYPPANVKVAIARSARHAGGLACTALAAAGQLGGHCAYVARLGDDELSAYIKSSLAGKSVDVTQVIQDESGRPFHSIIVVDESGARTIFYDCSQFHVLKPGDVSGALIESARIVFLDYLADPPLTEIAEKIRGAGVPILADIEGRSEACRPLLPLIDYLIVSEEFAGWIAGTNDLMTACAQLAAAPRCATIVTAGAQGCYLATSPAAAPIHMPAFRIEATDTNGCGDTFHGAFALAIARQFSIADAAKFASAAAALKATGKGGWSSLPAAPEVLAFLKQHVPPAESRDRLLEHVESLSDAVRFHASSRSGTT